MREVYHPDFTLVNTPIPRIGQKCIQIYTRFSLWGDAGLIQPAKQRSAQYLSGMRQSLNNHPRYDTLVSSPGWGMRLAWHISMNRQSTGVKDGETMARVVGAEHLPKPVEENPQLRVIERLVGAKATTGIRSPHFWIILALMAGLGYVYYGVLTAFHDVLAVFFFTP